TDQTVRLWDIETGREAARFQGHAKAVWSVAYSPDGRAVLSGSGDGSVRLWALPPFASVVPVGLIREFQGHEKRIDRVAVSPDGQQALSAGFDETVRVWELATGRELGSFTEHKGSVRYVTYSADGKLALSC